MPLPRRGENLEGVPCPVHDRHRPGAVEPGRQRDAVFQPAQPAAGLALREGLALLGGAVGRVELDPGHAQRHAVAVDGQRRVHVQSQRAGTALAVASDDPQALAAVMRCQVDVGPVLDQQHRLLLRHPAQRPLAMPGHDPLRRDRVAVRVVDQPVAALHDLSVPRGRHEKGARRKPRLDPGAGDEPLRVATSCTSAPTAGPPCIA